MEPEASPLAHDVIGCAIEIHGDGLLVEVKSVDALNAVHQAQVLTYLKLSGIQHGLLINFNARLVKDGIKSFLLRRVVPQPTWLRPPQDRQP